MAKIRVRKGRPDVDGKCRVTHQVQIRLAGHRQVTKTFDTRSAARNWQRALEAKLASGETADSEAERRTLHDLVEQYLKTHQPDKDVIRVLRWWQATYGRKTLSKVTSPWLTQIRDELAAGSYLVGRKGEQTERGRKASTVNRRIAYLRVAISYGVEIGWLSRSPKVKRLTEAKRIRFLSDDELAALTEALEACGERVMLPLVFCAISSGARAGELLSLEWKDVDLAKGVALIHKSKNTDGRKLYIRGQALEYLKAYGKVRDLRSPGVFLLNSGAPLTHSKYGKLFREALAKAGIANFRFHDLRHCCASFLAQNGATLLEIQQVLGHRTPAMTARYAHLVESHVEAVVDRVMKVKLGTTS